MTITESRGNVLVVSPHPDDESIGAPVTLHKLQEAGFHVVNFAVSLGRPADHARRRAELEEACDRASFGLIVPEDFAKISGGDDMDIAQCHIAGSLSEVMTDLDPVVTVSPSVWDNHHGHEVVARGTRDALETSRKGARWMMYGLWGALPYPNIYTAFGQTELDTAIHNLGAYEGEVTRNDYRQMVTGTAILGSVLGTETIFGFGAAAVSEEPYAELLTEAVHTDRWLQTAPCVFDVSNPLPQDLSGKSLQAWTHTKSPYQEFREQ